MRIKQECHNCGVEYTVTTREEDLEVLFCPFCGEAAIKELDFSDEGQYDFGFDEEEF